MKIISGVLIFWIYVSSSYANDAAEATAAILEVAIQKNTDSSQIEIGAGPVLMNNKVSPEFHFGANYYFLSRYKAGVSLDASGQQEKDTANANVGVIAGVKNFNRVLGRHFINLTVGGSMYENDSALYLEPSISFRLKESSAVKYFWIMHTFGVNASVAYRHVFLNSQQESSLNSDAVLLKLNFYLGQRERKY